MRPASVSSYQRQSARQRAALRLLASFDEVNAPHGGQGLWWAIARKDFAHLLADALFWRPPFALRMRMPARTTRGCTASTLRRRPCDGWGWERCTMESNIFGDPGRPAFRL